MEKINYTTPTIETNFILISRKLLAVLYNKTNYFTLIKSTH